MDESRKAKLKRCKKREAHTKINGTFCKMNWVFAAQLVWLVDDEIFFAADKWLHFQWTSTLFCDRCIFIRFSLALQKIICIKRFFELYFHLHILPMQTSAFIAMKNAVPLFASLNRNEWSTRKFRALMNECKRRKNSKSNNDEVLFSSLKPEIAVV